jgi:hypothetical protein
MLTSHARRVAEKSVAFAHLKPFHKPAFRTALTPKSTRLNSSLGGPLAFGGPLRAFQTKFGNQLPMTSAFGRSPILNKPMATENFANGTTAVYVDQMYE